jgi:hypothetical protein
MSTSVFVYCALDGILRRSLGSRSMRAEGGPEVDDVSGCNVVDETCLEKKKRGEGRKKAKKPESISLIQAR